MEKEINKKINNRGGVRAGAGRPVKGVVKVARNFKILPETSEAINALAKDSKSYGSVVDKAVKYLLENSK